MKDRRFHAPGEGIARIPCRVCFRAVDLHPDFVTPSADKWIMRCPHCSATFPVRVDDSAEGFARRHGVDMPEPAAPDARPSLPARGGALRVLVADDEPTIREFLRTVLEVDGLEVIGFAGDGHEVLRQVAATQPDVVVLDLMMPGMSGLDVLPLLKERHPDLRVVAVSAMPAESAEREAFAVGADAFVSKLDVSSRLTGALGRGAQRTS